MESLSGLALAGVFMAVLGILLATVLALANRRLYVFEDPRIGEVEELLPRSNCGACGQAGCRAFAEQAVEGKVVPAQCTVCSPSQREQIADLLGVAAGSIQRQVARLACAGGKHVAFLRARYAGHRSCRAAASVAGGGKECAWGCLGLGDCAIACDFDAIRIDRHGLPVVDADRCTACNDCVEACPKGLFSLHSVDHKLWVACANRADPDTAAAACEVACTACGKCVADAAPDLIRLDHDLAVIDYERNDLTARQIVDRCASGAIVWYETPNHAVKGAAARKILRTEPLPLLH